ncbi:LOW QUALITY PROTEIN: hypothetical protein KUTeg_013133 [Tegillarca granosa]|uniref:Uncharacterized protein n=1 Tax=Tegillarca granosa TaxID=220873 RepID=A0ABQ9ESU0_TEGGR|nr:LOW QUALITY PROTEIN: hypothetical protein KUTeg_013133 [Tegillarca granosa]
MLQQSDLWTFTSHQIICPPLLENLEVLHLGYNGIKDIPTLQLRNEIQKVEGLDGLHDLRELVLDRNRIKNNYRLPISGNLQELHMEENRIRDLANISCLDQLQRLYLGSNRIQEISELDRVEGLNSLLEISLVNNPVARRHVHRPVLVFKLKQLMVIDGIPVTDEERAKAELYFMDQQVAANVCLYIYISFVYPPYKTRFILLISQSLKFYSKLHVFSKCTCIPDDSHNKYMFFDLLFLYGRLIFLFALAIVMFMFLFRNCFHLFKALYENSVQKMVIYRYIEMLKLINLKKRNKEQLNKKIYLKSKIFCRLKYINSLKHK